MVSAIDPGFSGWVTDTRALFDKATTDAYWFQISGTEHLMFHNWAWIDNPTALTREASLTMRACIRSFFNKYLKNEDDHLLDNSANAFPRVINFMRK